VLPWLVVGVVVLLSDVVVLERRSRHHQRGRGRSVPSLVLLLLSAGGGEGSGGARSGEGSGRAESGLDVQCKILGKQVVVDVMEGGERLGLVQKRVQVVVLLVQAPYNIKNKSKICHRLVEVAEGVDHALQLAVVVICALVALDKYPEVGVEVVGTGPAIVEDVPLDGKPDLSTGAIVDNVLEVDGDGVEESLVAVRGIEWLLNWMPVLLNWGHNI
jgi:hypothetical protein